MFVCLQCEDASCQAVCPTGALVRNFATGAIELLRERCIKCKQCVAACPFGCMGWDEAWRSVQKCDLCGTRLEHGLEPACVRVCPTKALGQGDPNALALEQEKKAAARLVGGA